MSLTLAFPPKRPRASPRKKLMAGFSLIEALVSVLVLSIGLLGVAALQGVGLRANSSANHRSQAAWFAAQMVEEARARRDLVVALDSGMVDTLGSFVCGGAATTPIAVWRSRLACALPSGQGGLAYNTFTQRLVITVQWDDSRGVDSATAGGSNAAQFSIETIL